MKRRLFTISVLLIFASWVAACSPTSELPLTPIGTETGILPPGAETTLMPPEETEPGLSTTNEPSVNPTETITGTGTVSPTSFIDPGRVSNLLDFAVWNQSDEQIGEVEDLVLNLGTAHLDYVIVQPSSETGTSGQFVPIPWNALMVVSAQAQTVSAQGPQNDLLLVVDQQVFDNAPRIELDAIPEVTEEAVDWDSDLKNYWAPYLTDPRDETPYPDVTPLPEIASKIAPDRVTRVTETLNFRFAIASLQVEVALADLILDINTGDLQYIVIAISNEAMTDLLVPVPPGIIRWDPEQETYTLVANPEVLLQAPSFKHDEFPITQVPDWDRDFRDYWADYLPTSLGLHRE